MLDANSKMIICAPVLFICFLVLVVAFSQFNEGQGLIFSAVSALFSWVGVVVMVVVFPFKVSKAYYAKCQERYPQWPEELSVEKDDGRG